MEHIFQRVPAIGNESICLISVYRMSVITGSIFPVSLIIRVNDRISLKCLNWLLSLYFSCCIIASQDCRRCRMGWMLMAFFSWVDCIKSSWQAITIPITNYCFSHSPFILATESELQQLHRAIVFYIQMFIPLKSNSQCGIPVILEFGSLNTRAGFAGKDRPDAIVPSYVAANKTTEQKTQMDFFSCKAPQNADPQSILENCFVEEWENARIVAEYSLCNKLFVNPPQSAIFYVEPALSSKQHRQKLIEYLFEDFGFNGLFMHKAPVLSTYLFAKESAMIVDVGAEYTHVVPVIEGYICSKSIMRADVGGQTLTRQLGRIAAKKDAVHSRYSNRMNLTPQMEKWGRLQTLRQIKQQHCTLLEFKIDSLKFNEETDKTVIELPDKTKLDLGRETYSIPQMHFTQISELNYKGLQHLIYQSFEKCQPQHRKELFANIQVVGGGSAFPNFTERLQKQLMDYDMFGYANRLRVLSTQDRQQKFCSSWLGASIMSSMSIFQKYIITKKEYEQHGAVQVEKKL